MSFKLLGELCDEAPGKRLGYVILPIVVKPGVEPEEALNDQ